VRIISYAVPFANFAVVAPSCSHHLCTLAWVLCLFALGLVYDLENTQLGEIRSLHLIVTVGAET